MFNFDNEIRDLEEKKAKCKLCNDTGKYFLYNKNIYYVCYACDAKDKKNDIHDDTRHN